MKNHYKFWIALSFLLIFSAGIFSGVILDKHVLNKQPDKKSSLNESRRRRPSRFPTLKDMARELQLSTEQQGQFQEIFDRNEERLNTLGKEIHKRFDNMRVKFIEELKSVLDQDQTKKFDAIIEKYLAQRKAEMEKRRQYEQQSKHKKGEEK